MSQKINPNYFDLGLSDLMGLNLRNLVEQQLLEDLKFYDVDLVGLRFDWSESIIEGHLAFYLDSQVENYSGISIFDSNDNLVADGWMEFVFNGDYNLNGDFFLAYWDSITIWDGNIKLKEKEKLGIPNHVWNKLPDQIKPYLEKERVKQ